MKTEPAVKQVVVFVDGQNLYRTVKTAFGYSYPNYNLHKLSSKLISLRPGWQLKQIRFYTGIPEKKQDPMWHSFWAKKLSAMGKVQGTFIFTRELKYRILKLKDSNGVEHTGFGAVEKGIDVRIALDIIRLAHKKDFDVALVLSQDQDLSEAADEIRCISDEQDRYIFIASAYPESPVYNNLRGINNTSWIPFNKTFYDDCLDSRDYRDHRSH
ncbi:MAG: hypothetical protein A2X28_08540 [Elusimicrobia bacterium GWA2_56_46]|nr:MAG: hypothetical protein A2X28_08540 [Elusimicrobia bacterium GWA2_56_46]OGR55183.1 MAG: hypothetical protein A2X39_01445 [Elusimicrobia bacterium GWC2_56_31]HBB66942.1 NYN domain-containing protein [Elusimicrobiota bacterium]HBW23743.1 NYN domain-containing protein [Elusimicrobiota bacterium]